MATTTVTTSPAVVSSPSTRKDFTPPERCLCGNLLPLDATTSLPPPPPSHDDDENSIYCSMACARQDALDSLNAKEKDLRHSASSLASSSSLPMSASMSMSTSTSNSTSTFTSESSMASSTTSFSEQHGAFSSLSCLPSEPDSEGGEDEEDDDCGLWEFVTPAPLSPTPTSTATATFTSQHSQQPYMSFKSHYQRVVARENALKEESGVSSSSPSYLALCKPPPPPPSSPASLPTLTPAPHAVLRRAPARKRVVDASSSFSDNSSGDEGDEDRARTPRSWGVNNNNNNDNDFSAVACSTPLPPSPSSTSTTTSTSTLTATSTSTSSSQSESESPFPRQQKLKQKQGQQSQTRTLSQIMRSLVDREPGVLEHYQTQWAYPPSDWVRGDVVDYAREDEDTCEYDYDGEDSDDGSEDDDEIDVYHTSQREFSALERPMPPPPPSPIQARSRLFAHQPDAELHESELGSRPPTPPPKHDDGGLELSKYSGVTFGVEQQLTPTLTPTTTTVVPTRLYSPREVLEALALPPPFIPLSPSCKQKGLKRKGKKSALAPIDTHAANRANHSSRPDSSRGSSASHSPSVRVSRRGLRLSASSLFRRLLPISRVRSRCGSAASVSASEKGIGLSSKPMSLLSSLSSASGSCFGGTLTEKTILGRPLPVRPVHQSVAAPFPSHSSLPSTHEPELNGDDATHVEQDVFCDLRTPPMTTTSSSSSSFMVSPSSVSTSMSTSYSSLFPRTPYNRSIVDGSVFSPTATRNADISRNGAKPSHLSNTTFYGERKGSLSNLPFPSNTSPIATSTSVMAASGMPFSIPLGGRRHPRLRPQSKRIETEAIDQSDEDDVRDPFRYDSMLFAAGGVPCSHASSSVATSRVTMPTSPRSPLLKPEEENGCEEEDEDEEDARRAWEILQSMRAAEFTYCAATISSTADE